tara:strand:- start:501 stop:860 length:360 start_codon:yes stop_codon:yes gene_type:complete
MKFNISINWYTKWSVILLFLSANCFAEMNVERVYMANQAGGHIILTQEECKLTKYSDRYKNRAYATTSELGIEYEACYDVPSIEGAPDIPGFRTFPIVNYIDEDGLIVEYHLDMFSVNQ